MPGVRWQRVNLHHIARPLSNDYAQIAQVAETDDRQHLRSDRPKGLLPHLLQESVKVCPSGGLFEVRFLTTAWANPRYFRKCSSRCRSIKGQREEDEQKEAAHYVRLAQNIKKVGSCSGAYTRARPSFSAYLHDVLPDGHLGCALADLRKVGTRELLHLQRRRRPQKKIKTSTQDTGTHAQGSEQKAERLQKITIVTQNLLCQFGSKRGRVIMRKKGREGDKKGSCEPSTVLRGHVGGMHRQTQNTA